MLGYSQPRCNGILGVVTQVMSRALGQDTGTDHDLARADHPLRCCTLACRQTAKLLLQPNLISARSAPTIARLSAASNVRRPRTQMTGTLASMNHTPSGHAGQRSAVAPCGAGVALTVAPEGAAPRQGTTLAPGSHAHRSPA